MNEIVDDRSNVVCRKKHGAFERAWISAGCPKHFQWSPQTGRIWDLSARQEYLNFKSLSPESQRKLIAARRTDYENRRRKALLYE